MDIIGTISHSNDTNGITTISFAMGSGEITARDYTLVESTDRSKYNNSFTLLSKDHSYRNWHDTGHLFIVYLGHDSRVEFDMDHKYHGAVDDLTPEFKQIILEFAADIANSFSLYMGNSTHSWHDSGNGLYALFEFNGPTVGDLTQQSARIGRQYNGPAVGES